MKKSFLFLLLLHFVFVTKVQAQWDLQQCVNYALKNSLTLKQQALSLHTNKNNATQAKMAMLPNINLGAAHTYNFGQTIDRFTNTFANTRVLSQNFFASSNVTLWSGLSQYNNAKANEYTYLSSIENLKQQQNDLALNVASAYINVIFTDELRKISENQTAITKEQLERTIKLVNVGSLAKTVEYDLKAQLANDEATLISSKNNYDLALLNLTQLLNLDSVTNFSITKPQLDINENESRISNINAIYETALKNQPSIKSAEYVNLSAEKAYLASKGRISPSLSLSGSIGTGYSGLAKEIAGYNTVTSTLGIIPNVGPITYNQEVPILKDKVFADQFKDNVNKSVGLQLNVPIFNGWQTMTAVKNTQINMLNAKLNQDLIEQNLYKVIVQASANAKAALNKYSATKLSVEAASESFKYAQQKFDVGAISTFDFNSAKNRLFAAESNLIQAKYDYIFKLKVLDFYQGKPLQF